MGYGEAAGRDLFSVPDTKETKHVSRPLKVCASEPQNKKKNGHSCPKIKHHLMKGVTSRNTKDKYDGFYCRELYLRSWPDRGKGD